MPTNTVLIHFTKRKLFNAPGKLMVGIFSNTNYTDEDTPEIK